jgi:hypothetical protein
MTEYTVYFELYGKKMKTKVNALSENQAKQKILDKVVFHKVTKEEDFEDFIVEDFLDFFNKVTKKP